MSFSNKRFLPLQPVKNTDTLDLTMPSRTLSQFDQLLVIIGV